MVNVVLVPLAATRVSACSHWAAMGIWGPEANTGKRNSVLKALELERVFGHDLLARTVWMNMHFHVFGQLVRFKADKGVQQTHEVAQCCVIARNVEAAPPLYLSENVKKNQRIIRVGALTDFRGWVQNQRRLDRLCRR